MSVQDEASIIANDATVKDMEVKIELLMQQTGVCKVLLLKLHQVSNSLKFEFQGAAIAYVADLFKVPTIFVKAVTDIVDGEKPTAEEFLQNLATVSAALDKAVTRVISFVSGKCIYEL